MKKIIVIGDIHGRTIWRDIVNTNPDADYYVFVGDYFDSFDISSAEQVHNFREIIEFKNNNKDRVILLIGNHDIHYTKGCIGSYSGFNHNTYYNIFSELSELVKNESIIAVFKINNLLFTHAGVTKTWCKNHNIDVLSDIVGQLNNHLIFRPQVFMFQYGDKSCPYGEAIYQSPLWVRPKSLLEDAIDYIHIVGHTSSEEISKKIESENKGCIVVDTLEVRKYLEIVVGDDNSNEFNSKEI